MSEKKIVKHYSNGEVTVVWKPDMCIHSAICAKGLPEVFNPKRRPWVKVDASKTQKIVDQVSKCPSGALSTFYNDQKQEVQDPSASAVTVQVSPNGPLILKGSCVIKGTDGSEILKENMTAFCRCGASANKPYCDGSHNKIGFEG